MKTIRVDDYINTFASRDLTELAEKGYSLVRLDEVNAALSQALREMKDYVNGKVKQEKEETTRLYIKSFYILAITAKVEPERVPLMALDIIKELETTTGIEPLLPLEEVLDSGDNERLIAAVATILAGV